MLPRRVPISTVAAPPPTVTEPMRTATVLWRWIGDPLMAVGVLAAGLKTGCDHSKPGTGRWPLWRWLLDNNLQTLGLLLRSAQMGFENAQRRAPAFVSFACPKETNQRKGTRRHSPASATRDSLRFSDQTALRNSALRASDSPRLFRSDPAMLGFIEGTLGANHPEVALTLNNLALLYRILPPSIAEQLKVRMLCVCVVTWAGGPRVHC